MTENNWQTNWVANGISNFKEFVHKQAAFNSFTKWDREAEPTVVVIRNTNKDGDFVKTEGFNNCDTILLVDDELRVLTGRSFAADKYQLRQIQTKGNWGANKIASCYVKGAWRRGPHFGYPAGVQNVSFPIIRSVDMQYGNADDYMQFSIVADNFHGWAPESAGCITVKGLMQPPGPAEDWKIAQEWMYRKHIKKSFFSVMVFERKDFERPGPAFRYGSFGPEVEKLQEKLIKVGYQLTPDGDFGPMTLMAVRQLEVKIGISVDQVDGVADKQILDYLDKI